MANVVGEVSRITDAELVRRLEWLVKADRKMSAKMLVHLGEIDVRGVFRELGFSSMFDYCMRGLHMSEGEASLRIYAARLIRQFPLALEMFEANELHLSAIKLLAPCLTAANCVELLGRARGKSKREVEAIVAELAPKPDVVAKMRRLPRARGSSVRSTGAAPLALNLSQDAGAVTADLPPDVAVPPCAAAQGSDGAVSSLQDFALQLPRARGCTTPLSPGRFKLELTLGQEAHDQLEQLRALLRHQNPSGDLTHIIQRAIRELHERTMKKRFAQTSGSAPRQRPERARPAARVEEHIECAQSEPFPEPPVRSNVNAGKRSSRYVPRKVVREVYARDGGQCTFVGSDGRRCAERGFLEIHHHEITHARGGEPTPDNLRLACRAHNALYAERDYGREHMQKKLQEAQQSMLRNMCMEEEPRARRVS